MNDLHLLEEKCKIIRRHIICQVGNAGSGHPGGALSAVEILTALYFNIMNLRPEEPDWEDRDRFILSKGHASAVYYAVLAERGYFPIEELENYKRPWGKLPGHPDMKRLPGVDMSTGSLGQGLSVAIGMAIAAKYDKRQNRIYIVLGDGEIQEGQVWEAAMSAAHFKLDNITAFIDRNNLQIDGTTDYVMGLEPLKEKWNDFGWNVIEVDGHNLGRIIYAAESGKCCNGKPTMIIAKTVKGKGVSFMEGRAEWHGKVPVGDLLIKAKKELGCEI